MKRKNGDAFMWKYSRDEYVNSECQPKSMQWNFLVFCNILNIDTVLRYFFYDSRWNFVFSTEVILTLIFFVIDNRIHLKCLKSNSGFQLNLFYIFSLSIAYKRICAFYFLNFFEFMKLDADTLCDIFLMFCSVLFHILLKCGIDFDVFFVTIRTYSIVLRWKAIGFS